MKRAHWVVTMTGMLGAFVGCGGGHGSDDAGHELTDGHFQAGCLTSADCDDGMKCHTWRCNTVTHVCDYTDKMCAAESACSVGVCDEASGGTCGQMAAND